MLPEKYRIYTVVESDSFTIRDTLQHVCEENDLNLYAKKVFSERRTDILLHFRSMIFSSPFSVMNAISDIY